jgi:hypothetical protein
MIHLSGTLSEPVYVGLEGTKLNYLSNLKSSHPAQGIHKTETLVENGKLTNLTTSLGAVLSLS